MAASVELHWQKQKIKIFKINFNYEQTNKAFFLNNKTN